MKSVHGQLNRGAASPYPKKGGEKDKAKTDARKGVSWDYGFLYALMGFQNLRTEKLNDTFWVIPKLAQIIHSAIHTFSIISYIC